MGKYRDVKTKLFIKFLLFQGCIKQKNNGGSHSKYKKKGCLRPITVREKDKTVPALHIKTNLETLGIKYDVFYNWIENN